MRARPARLVAGLVSLTIAASSPALAATVTMLIIDLEGDGLRLSDRAYPVLYDLDGDGEPEATTWTASGQNEAILWRDVDADGVPGPTDGRATELFQTIDGRGSPLEELALLDQPRAGGDGDGLLSPADALWGELRLWIDLDHDGVPAPSELSRPESWGIAAIELDWRTLSAVDGSLNEFRAVTGVRPSSGAPSVAAAEGRVYEVGMPLLSAEEVCCRRPEPLPLRCRVAVRCP